jgi:1-acyl-sn-glycerol-3-phosphate acyltransferase
MTATQPHQPPESIPPASVLPAESMHRLPNTPMVRLKRRIAQAWLKANGWHTAGKVPNIPRIVMIAAPHTTNWDLAFMLAVAWDMGFEVKWIGKHTLFQGPLGPLMRWTGGLPIDRRKSANQVEQAAAAIRGADKILLAIAPEGTRKRAPHWKSGFYHIALAANVPILCGFLDYENKVGGFGPLIQPTGDLASDLEKFKAFYGPIKGKYPANFGPIQLGARKGELPKPG